MSEVDGTQDVSILDNDTFTPLKIQSDQRLGARVAAYDGSIFRDLSCDTTGRLLTNGQSVIVPPGGNPVSSGGVYTLIKQGGTSSWTYLIPPGKTLTISQFITRCIILDVVDAFTKISLSLYYQPLGTTVGEIWVTDLYMYNSDKCSEENLGSFLGGQTARMEIRRLCYSTKDTKVLHLIKGYIV